MSVAVILRPRAEADLAGIAAFVAKKSNVTRAERLVDRLQDRCRILVEHPLAGRPRDDLGEGIRGLSERPYVILYRVSTTGVEVIGFFHGARDLPSAVTVRLREDKR